jgi:hypothetical protein
MWKSLTESHKGLCLMWNIAVMGGWLRIREDSAIGGPEKGVSL